MLSHLTQSQIWSYFKNVYGTISNECDGVFYTLHRIPFINKYYAYCPKVNPFSIDFEKLKPRLIREKVIAINFDRPDITLDNDRIGDAVKIFENQGAVPAFKETYPPATVILDITRPEEEILKNFHPKHRYNLNVSRRKPLTITFDINETKIEEFYFLQKLTASRQKYFIRPKKYFETLIKIFAEKDRAILANVYYENEPIASWMFLVHDDTAYYVYGGMNDNFSHLKASTFLVWEAILELKKLGVKKVDFFGASEDLGNESDPYHGFTIFKIRFGGKHLKYMNSYDLVLSPFWYHLFNLAQKIRWKILKIF
jgi:lipid II:glycine glycyltransferase (peptidoglycan interpeptide bridge formation enzyme)